MTRSKILRVPYYSQPTGITCQSTCLKMMATYIEQSVAMMSTGAASREILDIWKDINTGTKRPHKVRNSHANMKWWLESHFPRTNFDYKVIQDEAQAMESIIRFIDAGYPVMVSVSHVRVAGHIILVVGYENYEPNISSRDFKLIVHDPYGRFDPSLLSRAFGQRRWQGGQSLVSGGERGPGQGLRLPVTSVSRQRAGDGRYGTYYLLSAH